MKNSKQEFGQFVAAHRRSAGLTQRELADRLFVTESAVSKWERGLSYPDIAAVRGLASELGVSTDELMSASVDHDARHDKRDANRFRRTRKGLIWSLTGSYVLALVACFIVNLSVSHRLDWFWLVLAALALAVSLTVLPLLPIPAKGWLVLGASACSLFALLGVTALLYGGGVWITMTFASIVLGAIVIFGPIWLSGSRAPKGIAGHATFWALLIDSVAIVIYLSVVLLVLGKSDLLVTPVLQLAAIGLAPVWAVALVIRYLPVRGHFRAAIAITLIVFYTVFVQKLVDGVLGVPSETRLYDLTQWQPAYLGGNITLLVCAGLLLLAVVLAIVGAARTKRS